MKIMNNFELKRWFSFFLLILSGIVSYVIIINFSDVWNWFSRLTGYMSPFITGFVIAYLLDIPCTKIQSILKNSSVNFVRKKSRGLSVLITFLFLIITLTILLLIVIPIFVSSIIEFFSNINYYYSDFINFVRGLTNDEDLLEAFGIESYIKSFSLRNLIEYAGGYKSIWESLLRILGASSYVFNITISLVSSVYILLESDSILEFFKKLVTAFVPEKTCNVLFKYVNHTNEYFKKFLYCTLIDGSIVGAISIIGLSLIGAKYAFLLGALEGITNMIPYFGAIVGTIVIVIVMLLTDDVGKAIFAGIFLLVLQQIDGNIIKVKLFGDSFQISPFLVILSITIGGAYYGVAGMVIAIPIVAVLKTIIMDLINYRLKMNRENESNRLEE